MGRTGGGLLVKIKQLDERAFAGAAFADDAEDFARIEIKTDIGAGDDGAGVGAYIGGRGGAGVGEGSW